MTQKIVIQVQMSSDRCRPRAMALAAATRGVDSVALAGDAKDQLVVVGDGVDPVKLTSALRRKVGPAQLVQVGDVKKEEEKKPAAAAAEVVEYQSHPGYYYPYHYQWQPEPVSVAYPISAGDGYGYACARPDTCSIM
ncbi:disease resistance protein Pikm1-TS-like [Lolium rigidum]|uniref:disease resistance protein Pikm1-TS-like n=1 Tax=Lolium rigidum TaxID=89674 RepID=UPI001F5C2105|nr:disease resistance protein Pikm1-TS-like [Lolium rigidum]